MEDIVIDQDHENDDSDYQLDVMVYTDFCNLAFAHVDYYTCQNDFYKNALVFAMRLELVVEPVICFYCLSRTIQNLSPFNSISF